MNELDNVIFQHCKKYPLSTVQDYVKLIYQNEFGGGHMISDPKKAAEFIYKEYSSLDLQNGECKGRYENIGNGIVRANLSAFSENELQKLADVFVLSANSVKGDIKLFQKKLNDFIILNKNNNICTDTDTFIEEYKKIGCPAIHHSDIYREVYKPAYRVIMEKLCF